MTLTNEHPIFDELLDVYQTAPGQVLNSSDWAFMRESRKASHAAWIDQLDAKHADKKVEHEAALKDHMKRFTAYADVRGEMKEEKKASKKAAAPKAPKTSRQKEANTNE